MFEDFTQEYFLELAAKKAEKSGIDMTEGTLVFAAASLQAVMLEDAFDKAEEMYINAFPDTCDREHLIRFARDRDLFPKAATFAVYEAAENIRLEEGTALSNGETDFTVTGQIGQEADGYHVEITCTEGGTKGNGITGTLDTQEYTENFEKCEIIKQIAQARDEEDTETFRTRYFESFSLPGQFGNEQYYRELILSVPGVSAARIFCTDYETIQIQIAGEDAAADESTVSKAQAFMEPFTPVGHRIAVSAAAVTKIDIAVSVKLRQDETQEDAKAQIEEAIDGYLRKLNLDFGTGTPMIIRLTALEGILYSLDTVEDCEISTVNGTHANLTLAAGHIAERGTVTYEFIGL